jgi:hypothetical protein
MANEVTTLGYTASGFAKLEPSLRLEAILSAEINLLLRDVGNLRNSQFMSYQGSINAAGSDTIRIRQAGLDGRDIFETMANEAADISIQAFTHSSVDLAVSRLGLMYQITDLASMTGGFGGPDIDPFRLAQSMSGSYEATFADKTADAASAGFSTTVGSNSTDLSVDNFFAGIYALEQADSNRGAVGPFAAVLHPKALTELQSSIRSETSNAVSYMPATAALLEAKSNSFVGSLFGVELYKSSYVNANASSGYDSFMFGLGGLAYADGVPNIVGAAATMGMDKIVIEMDRDATKAITKIIGHAYLGVVVANANKGCLLLSQQA